MNRIQYITFTKELVANGYQFRKDCPYQFRNKWIKQPLGTKQSYIELDLYKHTAETGEESYLLKPHVVIKKEDHECDICLTINFGTIDLANIEQMFHKYVEKLK